MGSVHCDRSSLPAGNQAPGSQPPRGVRSWEIWKLPALTRGLVLAIISLAGASTMVAAWAAPIHRADLLVVAVLLGAAAVSVEATRRVPEPAGMNANDMLGAWWLAITVLLPPVYALLAPAPLMALTQWRVRRIAPYKRVYSAAAIGLAHAAGSAVFHTLPRQVADWDGMADNALPLTLGVVAVGVLAKVLNAALVGVAVKTSDPETRWGQVFMVDHGQLEVTEVCAGVVMALVAGLDPVLVLLGLPPVLLLQRGMMYTQLHTAARIDSKTELLNAGTWEREAAAELADLRRRRRQSVAVLLIDLDHFKAVNDAYGHLVGDAVLRAVAGVLRGQFRNGEDLIGRFGGEEFAVFLPGVGGADAHRAAEGLRQRVAALLIPVGEAALVQVTVSVGVAALDATEATVTELLAGADLCLYQAKAAGRDQVRLLARPDRRASASAHRPSPS